VLSRCTSKFDISCTSVALNGIALNWLKSTSSSLEITGRKSSSITNNFLTTHDLLMSTLRPSSCVLLGPFLLHPIFEYFETLDVRLKHEVEFILNNTPHSDLSGNTTTEISPKWNSSEHNGLQFHIRHIPSSAKP
jgi:hypothetical protein